MQDILLEIQNIQNYLHGGYKNEVTTNIQWLDVSKFSKFNSKLQNRTGEIKSIYYFENEQYKNDKSYYVTINDPETPKLNITFYCVVPMK